MAAVRTLRLVTEHSDLGLTRDEIHKKRLEDESNWKQQALCTAVSADTFFPQKGQSASDAKAICRQCPVKDPCLEYALEIGEGYGVWGGVGARERRAMAKARGLR